MYSTWLVSLLLNNKYSNIYLPFITLICVICNGEWWNDENNQWGSKRFTKFVHILGNPLITTSEKNGIICKNYHEGTVTIVIIL